MFKKLPQEMDFIKTEEDVLDFWQKNEIRQKSLCNHEGGPSYVFYDGPPTANGQPHIGHVLTRVVKDLFPRYHSMKGEYVYRKAGWDTHGLPVELEVEKKLGLSGKEQIEEYGIEPFIKECRESVWKYKGMWEEFSDRVAFWVDTEHPYITYENNYIESEWWALKKIWEKGLLYRGFKIVPYCPRCGTPLSSHEVSQGYKDVKETSVIVKFRVKGEDASILAWTTTPWTLPSNVGLCAGPDIAYVKAEKNGEVFYLAESLANKVLGEGYTVLAEMTGRDLEYKEYEPLFNFVQPKEKCWYVTLGDYVSTEDGTGIVHIAPAFGEDDAEVGRNYGLPLVQLVDAKGDMTAETKWPGVFVKDADPLIMQDLEERGLLYAKLPFEHSYPFCWRCDTPLIYYARDSWFIKMTAVRDELLRNNGTVNWTPPAIGSGRFGDWLDHVQDWGISRNRYWGTPLNIWQCECGHQHAIGSVQELHEMSDNCPEGLELHKPYVDAVTLPCPECGGVMRRVPEVIDCWFDSGAMPFAQYHYPFENQELFLKQFPANFISEAVDQTRGWFYSLLAISTLLFDKSSFENVVVLGLVQDENGQKMSKSKGNAVDPFDALQNYGADAIRWYFYTASAPWLPSRFSPKAVVEGQRRFMGTLWNTCAFFNLYAVIDGFDPKNHTLEPEKLPLIDRWLLSRTNSMVKAFGENLDEYRIPEAARALQDFVDDLSNWYVRLCRKRFWGKGLPEDKVNAYMTLYTALTTLVRTAAPMLPFLTEALYQNLVRDVQPGAPESVHLDLFPTYNALLIDDELEAQMEWTMRVVSMGRAARNNASLKIRQPLAAMMVLSELVPSDAYVELVEKELNVRQVRFVQDADAFTAYHFKPQLKTLGPRFGKRLGEVRTALEALDGTVAMRQLNETGSLTLTLAGSEEKLEQDDLLIETGSLEGFAVLTEGDITVALDTRLTDELIRDGYLRETVSKLQNLRKEAGFEVTDHIRVYAKGSPVVLEIMQAQWSGLAADVLAEELVVDTMGGFQRVSDINGEEVELGVEVV